MWNMSPITTVSARRKSAAPYAEDGTSLFSRIENRRFMHTARHDLSERVIELLCRQIHREICTLHYGGQAVE